MGTTTEDQKAFLRVAAASRTDALRHVLLSARDVRHQLRQKRSGWTKHRFDTVALALARDGVITLHHHDHPQGLPPAEAAQMIADERDTHYVGFVIEADAPQTIALLAGNARKGSKKQTKPTTNGGVAKSNPPWLKGLRTACKKVAAEFGEACPADDLAPLRSFADDVQRALGRISARKRAGDGLYFIGDVWRAVTARKKDKLTLARFKEALVAAHRKDLLTLAKADLPRVYRPEQLKESATHDRDTIFSFVRAA